MKRCLWAALLVTTGCHIRVNRSVHTRQFETTPIAGQEVSVLLPGDTPDAECIPVADMHVSADEGGEHLIVRRFRDEAGKLGANRVHILNMEAPGFFEGLLACLTNCNGDADADGVALHCPGS